METIRRLNELIHGIQFAMLTTHDPDGHLRSRPMATQEMDASGTLWFFTREHSPKSGQIERDHRVCVSYADPSSHRYVSISGEASLVHDREKAKELWSPAYRAWFPQGLDDPELCLIRVRADEAQYWDKPSGRMLELFGSLKALLTGKPVEAKDSSHKLKVG